MPEISVESFLLVNDLLTPTTDLSPAQRERLADWLKETYLNELCRGRAVFSPAQRDNSRPNDSKTRSRSL